MDWVRADPFYEVCGPYRVVAYGVGKKRWRFVAWRTDQGSAKRLGVFDSSPEAKAHCAQDWLTSNQART